MARARESGLGQGNLLYNGYVLELRTYIRTYIKLGSLPMHLIGSPVYIPTHIIYIYYIYIRTYRLRD